MCVKKIDFRQPADLYIKKLLKKLKEDQNFSSLRQQFHLRTNATKYFCYLYKSSFLDLCSRCL